MWIQVKLQQMKESTKKGIIPRQTDQLASRHFPTRYL
jgi:hypothetical protein